MLVKGKDFNLFIQDAGEWKLIYCSQSCSLSINTEILPTTTKGDGAFARFIPQRLSWSVSASGVIKFDTPFNAVSLDNLQLSLAVVRVLMELDDKDESVVSYQGDAIITSNEKTGDYDAISTWSVDLQGSGPLQITGGATSSPTNAFMFQYDAEGGESSISRPELIGASLIDLSRNFDLPIRPYPAAYGSGEAQFRSSTGTIAFGTALMAGEVITGIYTT